MRRYYLQNMKNQAQTHRSLTESQVEYNQRLFWIDVLCPSPDDMLVIDDVFDLHPLTMEDVMTPSIREKTELHDHYLYVVINETEYIRGTNHLATVPINMIVFQDALLTIHLHPVQNLATVMYHLKYRRATAPKGLPHPSWAMYVILDISVDVYFRHVQSIENEVKSLDNLVRLFDVLTSHESALGRLGMLGKQLFNSLLHAVITFEDFKITSSLSNLGEFICYYIISLLFFCFCFLLF